MPAFLARVPMNLPLETALPVQCARGMPLLEAIEQASRRSDQRRAVAGAPPASGYCRPDFTGIIGAADPRAPGPAELRRSEVAAGASLADLLTRSREAHPRIGPPDVRHESRHSGERPTALIGQCLIADERGHLKVFIGMAPGVGKTFRMLQEGRAESDSGRDVVIGYLEPHGRAETVAQAEGLEIIPRRQRRLPGHAAGGDGPARGAGPRARAVPDRRAGPHQRAGPRAREALRGRPRRARRRASTSSRPSTCSTWRASTTRSPS